MRALAQRLNKENRRSGRQEVSAARKGTVLQVQREEPAEEEEEPLLLQRPERAQTLDELEELGREGCLQNEELPELR